MKSVRTPFWDLPAAGLLLVAVLTSVGRLGVTRWIPDLERVQTLTVLAAVLGLALGKSTFKRREVLILALGYSLTIIPGTLARIMDVEISLGERLASLGGRLLFSVSVFSQGRPVEDPLMFLTLLCLVYWAVGLSAGYYLVRHGNYLAAALPAGFMLLIIQIYNSFPTGRVWFLAFYIFIALVLLGRMNYIRGQESWRQRRVFLLPETGLDLTSGAAIAAAIIVLAAWSIPGLSQSPAATSAWENLTKPWRSLRDRLDEAFASAEGEGTVGIEFFGDSLALGTGTPLSQEVMFTVHLSSREVKPPRYYWRGRVYDQYKNRQWTSTAKAEASFTPEGGDIPVPDLSGRRVASFSVKVYDKQSIFYLPGQPTWVSRTGKGRFQVLPGDLVDVAILRSASPMQAGEVYQARTAIATPTIAELRAAGNEYPQWVLERYLQLPDDFSPAIRSLAQEVTASAETPYDKAKAVTDYLRKAIKFSPTIPAPIGGRDPLEYVLFDLKRGFCNYYASAEVLMLRSVGVPTRLAVGFAEGEPNLAKTDYTVLQRDAHAWPEVYFPGTGWVEFEPTSSQSSISRPSGVDRDGLGFQNPSEALSDDDGLRPGGRAEEDVEAGIAPTNEAYYRQRTIRRVLFTSLGLALVGLFWLLNRRYALVEQTPVKLVSLLKARRANVPDWLNNWALFNQARPVQRAFEVVNTSLHWLGEAAPVHATPAQRARVLIELVPKAAPSIQTLTEEHETSLYGQRECDLKRAWRASLSILWHTLRSILRRWLATLSDRF